MTPGRLLGPPDWDAIDLAAFDVDGTLYSQTRLRVRMMRDVLLDAASRRTPEAIAVLRTYRRLRERLAEQEVSGFETILIAETADATGYALERVRSIVAEWIERRPLAYLRACRYPGVAELFAGLRRRGKTIGIVSDYPAGAKLAALGLEADHVVCASDKAVGLLKPNPRGLCAVIEAAGTSPRQTVLIGDRADRDGEAARRIGAWALIKSPRPIEDWQTFADFDDAVFGNLLLA
ncbi:MAG: HAD family hydrolase [Xanthobacteraceae bacterium]|jgi:putative hydrolase of the HAD superfamily